jgi:hypothetical protein
MRYCFQARQTAQLKLSGSTAQVHAFFQDPGQLMTALVDPQRVSRLDRDRFAVRMRPIQALGLEIFPVVTLRITSSEKAAVQLEATGCQVQGNDWIDQHFDLSFAGELRPDRSQSSSQLTVMAGEARLKVWIGLPPWLSLTPEPIVQTIGNSITNGVLMAIRRSLCHRLPLRFHRQLPDLKPSLSHHQL